jgi:CDP-glycerol glycerophosphotransferase (TagB/SpsB family)
MQQRYLRSPNIHIDLGSRASTDMSYTQAADIYLGDVSSQVYEFLHLPRPCLFLNSHDLDWRGNPNFEHWRAGPVIDHPKQLADGLEQAITSHPFEYLAMQQAMRAYSFDLSEVPSSQRAADALLRFVHRSGVSVEAPHGLAA